MICVGQTMILASTDGPARGYPADWSLQGRLSWEKKTFVLLSSFREDIGRYRIELRDSD